MDKFECDEKRSATQLLLSFLFSPCRFECDEKRSACSISLCVVEFSGLNAMKSGVQLNIWEGLATSLPGLNAMKSGVQQIVGFVGLKHTVYGLNAMKSGVRLCGDFNFGDVKRCLKAMKSGVVLKKKFKGGSRRY